MNNDDDQNSSKLDNKLSIKNHKNKSRFKFFFKLKLKILKKFFGLNKPFGYIKKNTSYLVIRSLAFEHYYIIQGGTVIATHGQTVTHMISNTKSYSPLIYLFSGSYEGLQPRLFWPFAWVFTYPVGSFKTKLLSYINDGPSCEVYKLTLKQTWW